jgi:parvulin-like peptidyl-prolyl isomerase
VVAQIDGKNLTAGEIRAVLENTPALQRPFQQNPALALSDFYITKYLASEGEKRKLAESDRWKAQIEAARAQVMVNAMINEERDGYPVSEQMTDEYYKRNQGRYQQAKIKVIYIKFRPGGTSPEDIKALAAGVLGGGAGQRSEADAKALATELVKKIHAGADFAKLVAEYSEDMDSKAAGGDFGTVKPTSSYPDDFKKAVLALAQGEISEPLRQPSGYYVIRAEEKTTAPIADVRESIIQDIRQAHLGDFINSLRQRFTPKIERPEFFQQQQSAMPSAPAPGKP